MDRLNAHALEISWSNGEFQFILSSAHKERSVVPKKGEDWGRSDATEK